MPLQAVLIQAFADRQDLVVTTSQCLAAEADPDWVARQVSSGRWQRLHRGVLATYSGPLTWRTRARGALLYAAGGAALSHEAAGHLHGFVLKPPPVVDVTIPHERRVLASTGIRIHRRRTMAVEYRSRFAVVEPGDAALDLVEKARSDDDAVGTLCAAVRARTAPFQILEELARRPTMRNRSLVTELLGMVSEGVESPLELRYHRDVERRHGLPHAALQRRQTIGGLWIRADRLYEGLGVRTELDGELAHPGGRTDSDVWRDNLVLIHSGEITLRYRWRHVRGTPCSTAAQVVDALRSRGWRGTGHPCGPSCPVG